MNAIYELDSKWKKLLSADNFLSGLTVNEFVTELSKEQTSKQNNSALNRLEDASSVQLDAKPFIRTFESVLKELKRLQKETSSKTGQLIQQVAQMEIAHAKSIMKSNDQLNDIVHSYDQLDRKLSAVSQVVSPLGSKLEKSIKKKNAYIKSVEIISYYASFLENGECPDLMKMLYSNDLNKSINGALILKSLLILARKLDTKSVPKTLQVTQTIEEVSESFESTILEGFNESYRKNNFTRLNQLAHLLDVFNNGVNIIKNFTDNHEFFVTPDTFNVKESALFTSDEFKSALINADLHVTKNDETVIKYVQNIFVVIQNETTIVTKVFGNKSSNVMELFIKKVFEQKVRPTITFLLNSALSLSSLAYIRLLNAYFSLLNTSVKQLSEDLTNLDLDHENKISSCLEKCCKDLFNDILFDRSKFFEVEKRTLESLLVQKASEFNVVFDPEIRSRSLSKKLSDVTDFESSPELMILYSRSSSKFSQLNSFLKNRFERKYDHDDAVNTVSVSKQKNPNLFSLSYIDLMIKCSIESLARVTELVPAISNEAVYELVEVSLIGIVDSYIESALEVAYYQLTTIDIHRESRVDLSFLRFISTATEMVSIVSAYIQSIVLPLLQNHLETKRKIVTLSNAYFKKCELLMNLLVVETANVLDQKFSVVLAKQKKKDFLSKSQDFLDQDTETTTELVGILRSIHLQASDHLKNGNMQAFLSRIGNSLFDQLLNHYKKFQVSSTGGIIVTKDIIAYQTVIEDWQIEDLNEKFATLRELSNLFTVQPDLLTSLTKEGRLVNVERSIIQDYISKREDYNEDNFINKFKASLRD